ncbi:MAG: 16S rRNA (guanine(527)-N(7))-methyltransferase RsmG [Actinobacteria bacterium]|nr:16S rRNA (guanine(527)-N(7))-methyltransferase RsmG [Actinomycetota bacterium]
MGIEVDEGRVRQFQRYLELLLDWNQRVNLTAITDPAEVGIKHFLDSLSCLTVLKPTPRMRLIDVGTGAGFPGLPLKIVSPGVKLTLLDSLQKRLAFLEVVVRELGLDGVELVHLRAEEAGQKKEFREGFDAAVARAVARLDVLAELCLPLVKVGGAFLAMKGSGAAEEAETAREAIMELGGEAGEIRSSVLPFLGDRRGIVVIRKVRGTPPRFPRKPGTPGRKPLGGNRPPSGE